MEDEWQCQLCGKRITGLARRSIHMKNIWLDASDPKRCDNTDNTVTTARVTTSRVTTSRVPRSPREIRAPVTGAPLTMLARRKPTSHADELCLRLCYVVSATDIQSRECVDLSRVQDLWESYLREIRSLCSEAFWHVFLPMHTCIGTQLDASLQAIKKEFINTKEERKLFPTSRRALLNKINKELPDFWTNVLHTKQVDYISVLALIIYVLALKY